MHGIDDFAVLRILESRDLDGSLTLARDLNRRYSGNPLALNLVTTVIAEFYAGDVVAFLADPTPVFEDIRDILDEQIQRLSALERDILVWLAVARRPLTLNDLRTSLEGDVRLRDVLEAMGALQRRSLLEKMGDAFILQGVIVEYLTDWVVDEIADEIRDFRHAVMRRFSLLHPQAYDYVRESQARMLLDPIARRLRTYVSESQLRTVISETSSTSSSERSRSYRICSRQFTGYFALSWALILQGLTSRALPYGKPPCRGRR